MQSPKIQLSTITTSGSRIHSQAEILLEWQQTIKEKWKKNLRKVLPSCFLVKLPFAISEQKKLTRIPSLDQFRPQFFLNLAMTHKQEVLTVHAHCWLSALGLLARLFLWYAKGVICYILCFSVEYFLFSSFVCDILQLLVPMMTTTGMILMTMWWLLIQPSV